MPIDIKGLTNRPINNQGSSKPAGTVDSNAHPRSTSTESAGSDTVSLTASATQLSALADKISSLPIADTDRVAETRHALASGAHQIDPDSTASGLLATERAFAQKS